MPNLRGRSIGRDDVRNANQMKSLILGRLKKPSTDAGGATKGRSRSQTEQEGDKTEEGKTGGRAKKGKADLKIKAKTRTWSDVVKDPEEDKSETTGSGTGNGEKKTNKGLPSRQVDQRGQRAWNQIGRGAHARRQANKRSRVEESAEWKKPQVELEGECGDASST